MWYHISNWQNSNSMDLCVFPLNIYVILLYFWTCMFRVLQKPWWWHIQRYNYIRICHFDLPTEKVKRPVANTNHQHDVIYYRKLWALDLPQLHLNNFSSMLKWIILKEKKKIRAHFKKQNHTWWSAFGIFDGLKKKSHFVIW